MDFFNISNTHSVRPFSFSLILFTFYCLTNVLRWLPVLEVQMPIVLFCYILLLASCRSSKSKKGGLDVVIMLTIILLFFDYFFIFLQGGMRNDSFINRVGANYTIFVSFFPLLYVASGNFSKIDCRKFLNIVYFISFITAVTTIVGTFSFESPCRELATPDNVELDRLYKSHNIGGYGFIYYLVLLIPILVRELFLNFSVKKLLLLLTFAFCILRSEYTTAIIMTLLGLALALLFQSKSKILRLGIIVIGIVVVVSMQELLNWASSSVVDTSYTLKTRFDMMSDYSMYGDADNDLGIRVFLYMQSINAFLSSPLFGNLLSFSPHPVGEHSEILDYLGGSGLFGIAVFFLLLHFLKKQTALSNINLNNPYIRATLIIALLIALFNTFLTPELYFAILIIPLLVEMVPKDNVNNKVIKVAIR